MLGNLDHQILWPDFHAIWPSAQPGVTASPADTIAPFHTMGPWPIPTLNTAILLTSGVTLTIAHPRADRQPSRQGHLLDVAHRGAGPRLPVLPGL